MLFSGQWVPAKDPTSNQSGASCSNALWFADRMAGLYPGHTIGIVDAAIPGTTMVDWTPTYGLDALYGNMLLAAKQASQYGTIRGFLWYQGEDDTDTYQNEHLYAERMHTLFQAVCIDLHVAVVFVQLGPHPKAASLDQGYWTADSGLDRANSAALGIDGERKESKLQRHAMAAISPEPG
jgi:Carbohydrate esterase, sialic acid-specific acetylesterase